MSLLKWTGKGMEVAGRIIQRADIGEYLKERFEDLLNSQAEKAVGDYIEKKLRGKQNYSVKKIAGEFERIFRDTTFNNFTTSVLSEFENEICVPTTVKFIKYDGIHDDRFYALPTFILDGLYQRYLRKRMSNLKGLDSLYNVVFNDELCDKKKEAFIGFASKILSETAIKGFVKDVKIEVKGLVNKKLSVKRLSNNICFWGFNPSLVWSHNNSCKGHFYFEVLIKQDLSEEYRTRANKLIADLDARLLEVGVKNISKKLTRACLRSNKISDELRDSISVKRE